MKTPSTDSAPDAEVLDPQGEAVKALRNEHGGIPERIVPDVEGNLMKASHFVRYEFATTICKDKAVLDAACGVGYGSFRLTEFAAAVVGVDISPLAIEYARRRYRNPRLSFVRADLSCLPFPDHSFDVICAFEAIEHLREVELFLAEVHRLVRGKGLFVVSTPHAKTTTTRPRNPYHHIEYSLADFRSLLSRFFARVEVYGQRRVESELSRVLRRIDVFNLRSRALFRPFRKQVGRAVHTTPMEDMNVKDFEIGKTMLHRATELVAVCSSPVEIRPART